MTVQYKEILSITLVHSYYTNGKSQDFKFMFNAATERLFRKGRLLPRVRGDKLIIFAETRDNQPTLDLTGKRITVALVLSNPCFYNFTQKPADAGTQLYHNDVNMQSLSAANPTNVVGQRFEHNISKEKREVTLDLEVNGDVIESKQVLDKHNINSINYLLKNPGIERFRVIEKYTDEIAVQHYFFAAEFNKYRIDRIVTLRLDNGFLNSKPQFTLNFAAVLETLHYYIIARNYGNEFDQLSVSGLDKSVDGASVPVLFNKVVPDNFTDRHLSKEILGVGSDGKLVLFHSDAPLPRRNIPRLDIQLLINGDTLIPTLPLTGPERPKAEFIVHLSKPKT